MWIPQWLYERLPVLYLIGGVACVSLLGTSLPAATSALLLASAALLTYKRRLNAKHARAMRKNRRLPGR